MIILLADPSTKKKQLQLGKLLELDSKGRPKNKIMFTTMTSKSCRPTVAERSKASNS